MIVTVANAKGGVGKTTTSVFVAHALTEATGASCTLVDTDPQGSATRWAQRAGAVGRPLGVRVVNRSGRHAAVTRPDTPHAVIDTAPAGPEVVGAALDLADVVLVPTSASTLDLSVVQVMVDAAARRGKPAVVLLTRTRRTRSVATAEQTLRDAGVRLLRTHIPLREALALAFGQPVHQLHGYDLATAELLGALPDQPYSVDAVRQRAARPAPPPIRLADYRPAHAPVQAAPVGLIDDELIQRLKNSMARLAGQQ